MTEAEAREQLRDIAAELGAIRVRLLGIHAGLPAEAEEERDVVTVRSVIECVLNDSLEPAIRDLQTAAALQPDPDTTWEPPDV